jgi:hypothetical protein
MTEKLADVWTTRDYPVLVEVVRRLDSGERYVMADDVAASLRIDPLQVAAAGRALKRRGLITASGSMAAEIETFDEVSGDAYLITGLHPDGDDAVSRLVTALRQAADQVDDPDDKRRLRKLADEALGVSRNVLGGVLTALATGGMGIGGG